MVKKKKSIKHGWTTESSCKEAEGSCLSQKVTAHQQKHCEQVCAGHVVVAQTEPGFFESYSVMSATSSGFKMCCFSGPFYLAACQLWVH